MQFEYYTFITILVVWIVVEAWLIFRDRGVKPSGGINGGLFSYFLLVVAFAISIGLHISNLQMAVINFSNRFPLAIVFVCVGLFLRWWSIISLGTCFRTVVTIQEGQKVIDLGPYKIIRHPSYLGSLVIFTGIGIGFGNWIGLAITFLLSFIAFNMRMSVEEQVMTSSFGQEYLSYKSRTNKLIPFLY
jgi:protein-S-isoprenylcysteine O-methyltransferase Ste14